MKLNLENPCPCKICGDKSQIFYEQGNSLYCEICTVRYIACNIWVFDPEALDFYLTDIIFDKVKQQKYRVQNYLGDNDKLRLQIQKLVIDKILKNVNVFDYDKEIRTIKLFQKIHSLLKAQKVDKDLFFQEKKCTFCFKKTFNQLKWHCCDIYRICFPCYASQIENKVHCKVCKARSSPEIFKSSLFNRSSFSITIKQELSLDNTMIQAINWKNILTTKDYAKEYLERRTSTVNCILKRMLAALPYGYICLISNNISPWKSALCLYINQQMLNHLVEWKRSYVTSKMTSHHKNINIRNAEFQIDKIEKNVIFWFYILFIFLFFGANDFTNLFPYSFLYDIFITALTYIINNTILMHFVIKNILKQEELNFL